MMTRSPLIGAIMLLAACREGDLVAPPQDPQQVSYAPELQVDLDRMTRTTSGVYYEDVRVGHGDPAEPGDTVRLLYAGYLANGTLVEARLTPAEATPIVLGGEAIIDGWNEGIPGMRAGGARKLVVPPELGFGSAGKRPVPPNSVLVFDLELLSDSR